MAIENASNKAVVSQPKISRTTERDLFELPPLPKIESTEVDDYYELPIHNMLYSGDIDLRQVCETVYIYIVAR